MKQYSILSQSNRHSFLKSILAYTIFVTLILLTSCSGKNTGTTKDNNMISLDNAKITWIKDNLQERTMERELFSDASDKLIDSLGLQKGIPASISVFLLQKDNKNILFDTGNGFSDSRLIPTLGNIGIKPEDINYIFLTHMHGDHIGGLIKDNSKVFKNAIVYVSKKEFDTWVCDTIQNGETPQTIFADLYKTNINFFEYSDTLPCEIIARNGTGHTPGHTIFEIDKLLVVGDLIHGEALQLAHPEICANYDMDKKSAITTRIKYLKYAKEKNKLIAGMHLSKGFIDFRK